MSRAHRVGHARARYIGEVHEAKARIDSDVLYHNDKRDDTCVPTITARHHRRHRRRRLRRLRVGPVETFRDNVAAARRDDLGSAIKPAPGLKLLSESHHTKR